MGFLPADFHTTMAFATLAVCGPDFAFTVPHGGLGVSRQVSTRSVFGFARRCHFRVRRIWEILPPPFPVGHSNYISPLRLPVPPPACVVQ